MWSLDILYQFTRIARGLHSFILKVRENIMWSSSSILKFTRISSGFARNARNWAIKKSCENLKMNVFDLLPEELWDVVGDYLFSDIREYDESLEIILRSARFYTLLYNQDEDEGFLIPDECTLA